MFNSKIRSKVFFLFLFTIVFSLQGCGAERDTPFNPGGNSGSSSSRGLGNSLPDFEKLIEGSEPALPYSDSKQLVAIRDFNEMSLYWDAYVTTEDWDESVVDFETGQVFLFDRGELGDCASILDIKSVRAYDYSANTVKVIIRYEDSAEASSRSSSSNSSSSSSSSSSFSEPNCNIDTNDPNHPFTFYFVPSRKRLVIEEIIE